MLDAAMQPQSGCEDCRELRVGGRGAKGNFGGAIEALKRCPFLIPIVQDCIPDLIPVPQTVYQKKRKTS